MVAFSLDMQYKGYIIGYNRLVTAEFQLGEQVEKINWTPWTPSFRYQEAKKHLYDALLLTELMNKQDFDRMTADNKYKELVRAITSVGKKLTTKKQRHVGGRLDHKLKRLKHKLISQKFLEGKQSQNYKNTAEVIKLPNAATGVYIIIYYICEKGRTTGMSSIYPCTVSFFGNFMEVEIIAYLLKLSWRL